MYIPEIYIFCKPSSQNFINYFNSDFRTTKDSYVKLRKERDYHRMHHKRVVQEKNKLITDIKR